MQLQLCGTLQFVLDILNCIANQYRPKQYTNVFEHFKSQDFIYKINYYFLIEIIAISSFTFYNIVI